jgi:hypothetical protein
MIGRLKSVGIALTILGLVFVAAGAFAYLKVQDGQASLNSFSAAQDVTLSYNEDGQLVDRGETAGAQAIMALLKDEWKYPVVDSEFDPNDPVVNTASEYMYQMATITYHTLHSATTVTLTEPVEYNGTTYAAGDYEYQNEGSYWTGFDRSDPIEGPAREKIWTGTAHALIGELGVGTVTAQALQLGLGLAGLFAGVGATFMLTGIGLVWVTRAQEVPVPELRPVKVNVPA